MVVVVADSLAGRFALAPSTRVPGEWDEVLMGAMIGDGSGHWLALTTEDAPPHSFAWKEIVVDASLLRLMRGPIPTRAPPNFPPIDTRMVNYVCTNGGGRFWVPTVAEVNQVVLEAGGLATALVVQRQGAMAGGRPMPTPFGILGAGVAAPSAPGVAGSVGMPLPAWPAGLAPMIAAAVLPVVGGPAVSP